MSNAEDINSILLRGTVENDPICDHVLYGESFYGFTLLVPRLSGVVDALPVTLPGRMPFHPQKGDYISISGQLRTYKKRFDTGSRLIVTVFAKDMSFSDEEPENYIELNGFSCRPVVFRTTPFLREIADILLAVNRSYSKSDYIPCIAWGRNARYVRDLPLGTPLQITGRLQSRAYTKTMPDGGMLERTAYEVSCTSIAAHESADSIS